MREELINIESRRALLALAVVRVFVLRRHELKFGRRGVTSLASPEEHPSTMRCARATRAGGRALWRHGPRGLATAAVCTKLGAPLELQHDWRLPPLGPTDVRVRIAAAGVNYADLLQACA